MRAIAAVLFVALMGAGLARPDELFTQRRFTWTCDATSCEVPRADLEVIARDNATSTAAIAAMVERIRMLEEEAKSLRASKGCAKVEVVPKKPALPPGPYRAS